MSDLRICRICLRTEAKGYKFQQFQLKYYYEEVIALKVSDDDLPQWFCYECATMLHKFHKFKEKCYVGQKVLKEMLWKGPITYEAIYKIDRKDILESPLGIITVTDRIKSFNIVDSEKKIDIKNEIVKETLDQTDKDITDTLYVTDEDLLKQDINNANQSVHNSIEESSNGIEDESEPHSPISVVVDDKSNVVKLKCDDINTVKNKDKETSISLKELNKHFSENNWKIVHLTEEEAVNEFRKKAEDPKYLESAYKCRDCFKGFSKKDMLNRHVQSRHSEELGSHECRICRMRFKWRCHLRKHLAQHYTEYHCLRCQTVFRLETSALLHEEYHSGTTKKCAYCNEEFRHMTTYYSHVRTHRSAHVCAACGVSFVSGAGLLHHRARIHHNAQISSDDDDDDASQTFCDKCNIRFDSHKAYEEHLFHSNMHTELIKTEKEDDISLNKKILGKRLRDKITKELRKCDTDMEVIPVKSKRRKKIKRKHRKPSTCHQCGLQFPTQRACMKHHVTSHAGSSYHAPHERYICELCGASLAPGSVSVHQNMHSREKLHACDTCGKLFHSSVSLKRHTVTHTGEKPFGCPLCDKRFTQSNSMKLHYRTFHLKQPYPKRIRKKKKDEQSQTEKEDTYEEDSSSLPEPGIDASIPGLQADSGNVHVVSDVHVEMGDENMHYLTLS